MNFYIADTHFGHKNILKLCNRPFESIEQMNHCIIQNWNNKVKNSDNVYIVGDMFFKCENIEDILKNLKGKKHLILGNHDGWAKYECLKGFFESVDLMCEVQDKGRAIVLCHYPLVTFKHQSRKNAFMVHGHIHNKQDGDFWPILKSRENILNAGVDINGFAPVTLDEMICNNNIYKGR